MPDAKREPQEPLNIAELRGLVEKATPGPWTARGPGETRMGGTEATMQAHLIPPHVVRVYRDEQDRRCTYFVTTINEAHPTDAQFVATFDPEMVEKLLNVVEAAATRPHHHTGEATRSGCNLCRAFEDLGLPT